MARVILLLSVACLVAYASAGSSLDSVDIDSVFNNDRLLRNYVDCLLDKKPCSKEGAELKTRIPQVLDNNCSDCSENEKNRAVKTIKKMTTEKPELWGELKAKYDPTGEKTKAFEAKYNVAEK